METLLGKQKVEIDELFRLMKNYGSDGSSRKTKPYLQDKARTFPEMFRVIQNLDAEINAIKGAADDEQPYFKEKTFQLLKKKYEKAMNNINERLRELNAPKLPISTTTVTTPNPSTSTLTNGTSTTTTTVSPQGHDLTQMSDGTGGNGNGNNFGPTKSAQMNDDDETGGRDDDEEDDTGRMENNGGNETGANDLLTLLYEELMDAIAMARSLNEKSSIGTITAQLENLNSIWTELRVTFYREKSSGKNSAFNYSLLSQKYMLATGKLNDLLQENKSSNEPSSGAHFNLPVLKLHEFHGKISEWKSFIAKFDQLVHTKNIDDGTKMEHLKMVNKGDAAKLINHVDPSLQNYKICYDILRKRYENKREILNRAVF